MTKDELIAKQQLHIEHLENQCEQNRIVKEELSGLFYGIGQPLNDNNLKMDKDQLKWVFEVWQDIMKIN